MFTLVWLLVLGFPWLQIGLGCLLVLEVFPSLLAVGGWEAFLPWIKQKALWLFFTLAFVISWLMVLPLVLQQQVLANWHLWGGLGPTIAAIVVLALTEGWLGVQRWWQQLRRLPLGWSCWALAAAGPAALVVLPLAALYFTGTPLQALTHPEQVWGVMWFNAIWYALGEELGWRGYALPRLQERWGSIGASFVLAGVWGLWHLPFFFYYFAFDWPTALGFLLGLLGGTFCLTWLYNTSGQSLWVGIVFHASLNLSMQLATTASAPVLPLLNTGLLVVALLIVVAWLFKPQVLVKL